MAAAARRAGITGTIPRDAVARGTGRAAALPARILREVAAAVR